jgi:hypothetical protein
MTLPQLLMFFAVQWGVMFLCLQAVVGHLSYSYLRLSNSDRCDDWRLTGKGCPRKFSSNFEGLRKITTNVSREKAYQIIWGYCCGICSPPNLVKHTNFGQLFLYPSSDKEHTLIGVPIEQRFIAWDKHIPQDTWRHLREYVKLKLLNTLLWM